MQGNWSFGVLGPLRVEYAGQPLPLRAAGQRVLLAALLLATDRTRTTNQLVTCLWDDRPPANARNALQNHVLRLRGVLGGLGGTAAPLLLTRPEGYRLDAPEAAVDVDRFHVLLARARASAQAAPGSALVALDEALALWRGPALADVPSLWLWQEARGALEEQRLDAVELRLALRLALGRDEGVVAELEALVGLHPLRERFHAQLMLALVRGGRQAEALEAYQHARRLLVDELGIEPGPELQDLHRRVLTGDPALVTVRPPVSGSTPPDESAATAPHRLPADTRLFTGRQAELARLLTLATEADHARSAGSVVITVVDGMAGIGKTALAVHAAHRLAERFEDGQLFIDLHGYTQDRAPRTANQALETLLRALHVPPQQVPEDVEERAALYRERLAGAHVLIILDNAADESQVKPLIPGGSGCLVLITSRRKLRALDDAHILALDTLPTAEAVALFCAVAGPGRVTADDPATAAIVALCGHLPLTLRIAAALLRNRPAWSLEHLGHKLCAAHARLDTFADGDRDLAALFDLSSQALHDDQRRLYRRLGLIPGPEIDAHAAAALLNTDLATAERSLQELVDHNLLLETSADRYRMHDMIRAHARALAHHDPVREQEAALSRLLVYYQHTAGTADARMARNARSGPTGPAPAHTRPLPDAPAARAWLRLERANLTACLEYSIHSGLDEHTVALSAGLTNLLRTDGPWPQATAPHIAASAAAVRLGDLSGQARALTELGNLQKLTGDYPAATRNLRTALKLYGARDDKPGKARVLTELSSLSRVSGLYASASRTARQALDLYRETDDTLGQARALTDVGIMQKLTGDYPAATRNLRAALALYRAADSRSGQAVALTKLAEIQRTTGDYEGATHNVKAALVLCVEVGDRLGQANALSVLGKLRRLAGEYEDAAGHHKAALEVYRELGDQLGQANSRTHLAEVRRATGDLAGAARDLEESVTAFRQLGTRSNLAWALNFYAAVISATGDATRARALYEEALHLSRESEQPDDEAISLEGIGEIYLGMGELHHGVTFLRQALEIYQRLGMPAAGPLAARLSPDESSA
jgi:DNA-binding SARP family transcriptional activator